MSRRRPGTLRIGELASRTGLTAPTIRYDERSGCSRAGRGCAARTAPTPRPMSSGSTSCAVCATCSAVPSRTCTTSQQPRKPAPHSLRGSPRSTRRPRRYGSSTRPCGKRTSSSTASVPVRRRSRSWSTCSRSAGARSRERASPRPETSLIVYPLVNCPEWVILRGWNRSRTGSIARRCTPSTPRWQNVSVASWRRWKPLRRRSAAPSSAASSIVCVLSLRISCRGWAPRTRIEKRRSCSSRRCVPPGSPDTSLARRTLTEAGELTSRAYAQTEREQAALAETKAHREQLEREAKGSAPRPAASRASWRSAVGRSNVRGRRFSHARGRRPTASWLGRGGASWPARARCGGGSRTGARRSRPDRCRAAGVQVPGRAGNG